MKKIGLIIIILGGLNPLYVDIFEAAETGDLNNKI